MLRSFLSNAELFLDQAKASWWTAKGRAVARGVHIGPTRSATSVSAPSRSYPTGYTGRRSPNCSTGQRQHGDTALARWMTERARRSTGGAWQPSEVRRWLANRVYLGEVRYGDLVNTEAPRSPTSRPGSAANASRASNAGRGRRSCCPASSAAPTAGTRWAAKPPVAPRAQPPSTAAPAAPADTAFANDLDARRILGEAGWRQSLETRAADRDAKVARRELFAQHQHVSLAMKLDDLTGHDLRDLLAMVRHVFVRRRRGALCPRPGTDRLGRRPSPRRRSRPPPRRDSSPFSTAAGPGARWSTNRLTTRPPRTRRARRPTPAPPQPHDGGTSEKPDP